MAPRADIMQGTLDLMVLRTLETLGPLHGWGIAQRLEQVSEDALRVNQGTLYPALLRLEQRGLIRSKWGTSDNNRRARFYSLTASGRGSFARSATSGTGSPGSSIACSHRRSDMRAAWAWLCRLGRTLTGHGRDAALEEELRFHLEMQIPQPGSAVGCRSRRPNAPARLRLGGVEAIREAYRDQRGVPASTRSCRTCATPPAACAVTPALR